MGGQASSGGTRSRHSSRSRRAAGWMGWVLSVLLQGPTIPIGLQSAVRLQEVDLRYSGHKTRLCGWPASPPQGAYELGACGVRGAGVQSEEPVEAELTAGTSAAKLCAAGVLSVTDLL